MRRALLLLVIVLLLPSLAPAGASQDPPPWSEPPLDPIGLPAAQGGSAQGRHVRVPLSVTVPAALNGVRDLPVGVTLDLSQALAQAGYPAEGGRLKGFTLDPDSFILWELDADGAPLRRVAFDAFKGGFQDSDASLDADLHWGLRWVLDGASQGTRHFFLYLDSLQNGDKAPVTLPDVSGRLAASAGPGRGNVLYVPLYPVPSAQGTSEARSVRITSLLGPTNVLVFEYNRFGTPQPSAARTFTPAELPAAGSTVVYTFGKAGAAVSEGSLLLVADAPIAAEAVSGRSAPTAPLFVPAADGGYVGTAFVDTPPAAAEWIVFCPGTGPAPPAPCRVRFTQSAASQVQDIAANYYARFSVAAGSVATVQALSGRVAVQRTGAGFAAWPPLDGPARGAAFLGEAARSDTLLFWGRNDGMRLRFQSLVGSNPLLENRTFDPRQLFTDTAPWGTSWNRNWATGQVHEGGPASIREVGGAGGVTVLSGSVPGSAQFSGLVGLASRDGGLHYDFAVPAESDGTPVGNLVLFAPYPGTTVRATRTQAGTVHEDVLGPLVTNERVALEGAGWWTLAADRPVVVAWIKRGLDRLAGPAVGVTDLVPVEVGPAEYAGYALDVSATQPIVLARPGDRVAFNLRIENRARTISGAGVEDTALLDVEAPADWTDSQVVPSTLPLGAGADRSGSARVDLKVPEGIDASQGGVTVHVRVQSEHEKRFIIDQPLRINFVLERGVEVTANLNDVEARREIRPGENATFTVEVTNRGSVADSFDVDFSAPTSQWTLDLHPAYDGTAARTPRLAPGAAARILVDVSPVDASSAAARLVTHVLATSTSDRSVNDGVRLVTAIAVNRTFRILVDEPTRLVPPGGRTVFDVRIANDADVNEELRVNVSTSVPSGWTPPRIEWVGVGRLEDVGGIVSLRAREQITLRVAQDVPAEAPALDLGIHRLRFESTFAPDEARAESELRVLVASVVGLRVQAQPQPLPLVPGVPADLNLSLESKSNVEQRVLVTPTLPRADWNATDGSRLAGPWEVVLAPGQTRQLALRVLAPRSAPPAAEGSAELGLLVTSPGQDAQALRVPLLVSEKPALESKPGAAYLGLGRATPLLVDVVNAGNVPLDVDAEWTKVPSDWSVAPATLHLPPGGNGSLAFDVDVPVDTLARTADAVLRMTPRNAPAAALEVPWRWAVGKPVLTAEIVRTVDVGPDARTWVVSVLNTGDAPAYDVEVVLTARDKAVDRVSIDEILPGAQHVASLVGPRGLRDAEIRVSAAHTPDAARLEAAPESDHRFLPAPTVPALFLALAGLVLARRWLR